MAASPSPVLSPRARRSSLFERALHIVRTLPGLGWGALVIALLALFFFTKRVETEAGLSLKEAFSAVVLEPPPAGALEETAAREASHTLRHQWLNGAMMWLLPVLLLGVLRARRFWKLVPMAVLCLACYAWWLEADLHAYYQGAAASPLGEPPAPEAYYGKLAVMLLAFLMPLATTALYLCSTLLDRHLTRAFLTPFCFCFFGMLVLFGFFDFYDNGKDLLEAKFGLREIGLFYLVQVPKFAVEIIDISLLLAVLYALSSLSRHNEIISMIGAGRSVPRILLPIFAAGLFASVLALAFNYQWAPEADRKKSEMLKLAGDLAEGRKFKSKKTNAKRVTYINRQAQRLWFLQEVPIDLSDKNRIEGVEIHEFEERRLHRSLYAEEALWEGGAQPKWLFLERVKIIHHDRDPEQTKTEHHEQWEETGWTETPWQLLSESAKLPAEFLSVPQLASYLKTNHDAAPARLAGYRTWWHDRLARPLRCFIVVLFAAPLGIVFSRRGLMGSVAGTILLYFTMYFLTTFVIRMGESSLLAPAAAAWTINVAFGAVGLLLLWQRATNADPSRWWHVVTTRLFRRRSASPALL